LDGHMVQGHVDALGVVEELVENDKGAILTLGFSLEIGKYLAFKGSITINGFRTYKLNCFLYQFFVCHSNS